MKAAVKRGLFVGSIVLAGFAASLAHADPCKAIPDTGKLPPYLAKGKTFEGPVVYVGDGDSLCVGIGSSPDKWVEVRLADFYAPELSSKDGPAAKLALSRVAMRQPVKCTADHQSYDRVVATCTLKGVSLGALLKQAGGREAGNGFH